MSTIDKFKKILSDMFQMDSAELDFGIYRIMNQKRTEINNFLNNELIPQVREELRKYESSDRSNLEEELKKAASQAKELGVDPDSIPKVKELKEKLKKFVDMSAVENDIFSHLTSFFRRYYSDGDFISLRRYKEGVYAIPYEGEEVKLHWANADQYYIKTTEDFKDYAFKLDSGKTVHFRLIDAETEKDNNKAESGKDRKFTLCEENPLTVENSELFINFFYISVVDKTQKVLNEEAVERLLAMKDLADNGFLLELRELRSTEKNKNRTLLEKQLTDYTAKNSFDYFIHKDLGGFLRRELDFYIKNEVMHLDDLDTTAEEPVQHYLAKIKVIKRIGQKIISFLEQLENFQKKLWLKKKFVVETNYCITLDRINEEFYPEIIANNAQIEEWVKLFAIDEIQPTAGDLFNTGKQGYSTPLTKEFLKANKYLVLDTKLFSSDFKERLVSTFHDLDEECDGMLIHSENFQALNLISDKIHHAVSNVFIDPPYNTGEDDFLYKDIYPSSTWLTMINERISKGIDVINQTGVFFASIGDEEQEHLSTLIREKYGKTRFFATLIWEKKKKGSFLSGQIAKMKDYIICISKDPGQFEGLVGEIVTETETYPCVNASNSREERIIKPGIVSKFRDKDVFRKAGDIISAGNMNLVLKSDLVIKDGKLAKELVIEGNWRYSQENMTEYAEKEELYITQDLYLRRIVNEPRYKRMKDLLPRLGSEGESDFRAYDINHLNKYGWGTNEDANDELHQLLGTQYASSYPKPSKLLTLLLASSRHKKGYWLDYFAGSGTTGHAVINLNREDQGKRKFILVEMGEYFDTVLKPRIQKVIYSKDWKEGKPVSRVGSSHIFKYLRLESYEDTLNNLELKRTESQQNTIFNTMLPQAREEYILSYMLEVESVGSQSLLNLADFKDPWNYKLKITRKNETKLETVDLTETFNFLIGLNTKHIDKPQLRTADFERNSEGRLIITGDKTRSAESGWKFQKIEGVTRNGEKTLIIWRNLTGDMEKDNLMLEYFMFRQDISPFNFDFDKIYINGANSIENLRKDTDTWKVVILEEEFKKLMFDVRDV